MEWIPMEGFQEVSNSASDYAMKTAAEKLSPNPIRLIHTGYGMYGMKGADKYAEAAGWDKTCLGSHQAKLLLASFGMGEKKIAQAMKVASVRGYADVHHAKLPPLFSEKVASKRDEASLMIKLAKRINTNLYKEASYMENAQTVDALLSLNFVTPENLVKFVQKIPLFKSAISHLASCLIASRLGVMEIPEESARSAIDKLTDVVDGLETIRSTLVMQGKK